MIRGAGYEPTVVEYLKAGWTREQLTHLLTAMNAMPRDRLREEGTPAAELGLLAPNDGEVLSRFATTLLQILHAMVAHPILVNRPIVVTPKGVKLCRLSEAVFELLDHVPVQFTKGDGEVVRSQASA